MNTKPNSKIITVYAQISAIGTPKIQTKRVKMMRLNCSITNNKIIHNYDFTNTKFTLILWRIPPVATGYLFSIANFSLKHKIKTEFFPAVLYLQNRSTVLLCQKGLAYSNHYERFHTDLYLIFLCKCLKSETNSQVFEREYKVVYFMAVLSRS